ncbi:MAG: stage II sporulation protein M [Patescibacteria group bacterium]
MLESLINPKKAERRPWEMFFIGLLYSAVAILLADLLFLNNAVLSKYVSIFIILFTVMFSLPFMYYLIKREEKRDEVIFDEKRLLKGHGRALLALLFLFLGFVVTFSVSYLVLPAEWSAANSRSSLEAFCMVNSPSDIDGCVTNYVQGKFIEGDITTNSIGNGMSRVGSILSNNFYVLINCIIFSFLFGAGAIFILAWNASVIATAIGIFAKQSQLHIAGGFLRYLVHGLPEIAGYFVAAMAGGIIGVAIIRHRFEKKKFWNVLKDSLDLIILAILILIIASFMEVFITPLFINLL